MPINVSVPDDIKRDIWKKYKTYPIAGTLIVLALLIGYYHGMEKGFDKGIAEYKALVNEYNNLSVKVQLGGGE